jgi:hypothetical protein
MGGHDTGHVLASPQSRTGRRATSRTMRLGRGRANRHKCGGAAYGADKTEGRAIEPAAGRKKKSLLEGQPRLVHIFAAQRLGAATACSSPVELLLYKLELVGSTPTTRCATPAAIGSRSAIPYPRSRGAEARRREMETRRSLPCDLAVFGFERPDSCKSRLACVRGAAPAVVYVAASRDRAKAAT